MMPRDLLSQLWLNDYSPMTASGVLDNTSFQVMIDWVPNGHQAIT